MKAIFLDHDGTLADTQGDAADPRRIRLCYGAGAALRLLACLDYRFIILSSQPGVAYGRLTMAALARVHDRLADLLFREQVNLDGFYCCPHHPNGSVADYARPCTCRKPLAGLLLQAANENEIDLRASWMVGATLHDVEAGKRAGCRTALIDTGREMEWRLGSRRIPTCVAPDLYAAAVLIANADGAGG